MIPVKKCCACSEEKPLDEFNNRKASADGKQPRCKACQKKYREENADRVRAVQSEWQKNNVESRRAAVRKSYQKHKARRQAEARQYAKENREAVLMAQRKWREKNRERERLRGREYSKNNPDKVRAQRARRHSAKLKATPSWSNKFIVDEIYALAQERQEITGVPHHVDHIVPLQGNIVCGLHCEDNLQVLAAYDNLSKHNKLVSGGERW
jgi:hypothetical protein